MLIGYGRLQHGPRNTQIPTRIQMGTSKNNRIDNILVDRTTYPDFFVCDSRSQRYSLREYTLQLYFTQIRCFNNAIRSIYRTNAEYLILWG